MEADTDGVNAWDYVQRQETEELEAAIAASKTCTYSCATKAAHIYGVDGIAQPVYSCITCADGGAPVGVCEPCYLGCHVDHDVVEVGTRRAFRCDCPTIKSGVSCQKQPPGLPADGQPINSGNRYEPRHNFSDKFCTCSSAYDRQRDTMIQCVSCDEWYHDHHIKGVMPAAADHALICARCVIEKPYFRAFARYRVGVCANTVAAPTAAAASSPPPASAVLPSNAAVLPSVTSGPSSTPASPSSLTVGGGDDSTLQPWVCCLTCTEGADDGRGVCMACAAACHAGHVLTQPRIMDFRCDCHELCGYKGGKCGIGGDAAIAAGSGAASHDTSSHVAPVSSSAASSPPPSTAAALAAINQDQVSDAAVGSKRPRESDDGGLFSPKNGRMDPAAQNALPSGASASPSDVPGAASAIAAVASPAASIPAGPAFQPLWCCKRALTDAADGMSASGVGTAGNASFSPPPSSSSSSESSSATATTAASAVAAGASMFLDGGSLQDSLLPRLCTCPDCMKLYARDGIVLWWFGDEGDEIIAPDCEAALLAARTSDGGNAAGVGNGTSAGAGSGSASSSSAAAAAAGSATSAATSSTSTAPSAPAAAPAGFRSSYELGLEAFSRLPATRQVDYIRASNDLNDSFMTFLRELASAGKSIVTDEDVKVWKARFREEQRVRAENAASGIM